MLFFIWLGNVYQKYITISKNIQFSYINTGAQAGVQNFIHGLLGLYIYILLEKQRWTHKRCTLMDPHTRPRKSRTTSTNVHSFSSYVRIQVVVLKTYLGRWTIGRSGERGSGISVLPARYDDDDDIYIYIYIESTFTNQQSWNIIFSKTHCTSQMISNFLKHLVYIELNFPF